MKRSFYDLVDILDKYKILVDPTLEQTQDVLGYITHEKYTKYFFSDLENPAWVLPLFESGFFNKIPPPLEDLISPGYFSMPEWHAGEYLKRMADQFPDIVKELALSLETENSRAIRTMLEALLKIPADITAITVSKFRNWVNTPFANFMMLSHDMGLIMEYLTKGGQTEAALKVLAILLEPIQTKDRFEDEKLIATTLHDPYWLDQAIQLNLPVLTEIEPNGVLNVAESLLYDAFELEQGPEINDKTKKTDSYWRLSISPRSDLNYERDLKNLLINIMILSLQKLCEQKQEKTPEIIARYLESEYMVLRRIGIYVLRSWGEQYPDLLEVAYIGYSREPIHAGAYEFERFVEIQYKNLPIFAQKEILKNKKNPDPQRVEEQLEHHPELIRGDSIEEKRQTLVEKWQWHNLSPIASFLEDQDRKLYNSLVSKYGEPPPRSLDGVTVTSWEGPESPIELNELAKKPTQEVIHYLLRFPNPSDDSFGKPTREGLGRTLEADVQGRANEYAHNAHLFINHDLPFVYHTYFLRGLENAVKKQERISLSRVITLCEFIVDQKEDKFDKQEFEEGLPAAKLAILHLFEELFRVQDPYIEDDLLESSGKIIVTLLHQKEPFVEDEQVLSNDPANNSLNCIHGVAMHAIVALGLYCERKRKKNEGGSGLPEMIPILRETLIEQLDKKKFPSLAVHSVFGWYFPQFMYLDKDWAIDNREKIFLKEKKMTKYWQAAWSAYIRFTDVYTNVFPELIDQYKRALKDLPVLDKKQDAESSKEKIATHILKAYLLDMIKLNSEDRLIALYYQNADDETRSRGNFWLSNALDSQKPSVKDKTWQKIWDLWQLRINEITSSVDKQNYVKEIGDFCRLLKNVPLDLSELYSIIEETVKYKINGFNVMEIIKYLGKNCDKYPKLSINLLQGIILSNQDLYLLDDIKDSVKKIITIAMNSGSDSREKATEIINLYGERGDYSWRPLLKI